MTDAEKKLLVKDLCGRIPYGVKFSLGNNNAYTIKGIDLIVTDEGDWEYAVTAKGIPWFEIKYIKPFLRPMNSMTEKENEELKYVIELGLQALEGEEGHNTVSAAPAAFEIDFYNKHHFDYRGLIEKGLALEAPKDMYALYV